MKITRSVKTAIKLDKQEKRTLLNYVACELVIAARDTSQLGNYNNDEHMLFGKFLLRRLGGLRDCLAYSGIVDLATNQRIGRMVNRNYQRIADNYQLKGQYFPERY